MMGWSGPRFAAMLAALAVALLYVVGGLAKLDHRTDLDAFLPRQDPVAQQYEHLTETFGADPIVVLLQSTNDRSLLAEKPLQSIVRLEGSLARLDNVAGVYGPGTLLNQIAGRAQDLMSELFGRRDAEIERAKAAAIRTGESPTVAADRARTRFDARYGPLLVEGLPSGLPTLGNAKFVNRVVFDDAGHPRPQWRLVVPSRNSLAVLVRPRERLDAAATSQLVHIVRSTVSDAGIGDRHNPVRVRVAGVSVLVSALSDRAVHDVPLLGGLAVGAISLCFFVATWIKRSRRLLPVATTLVSIVVTVATMGWLDRPLTVAALAFLTVLLGIGCYYPTYLAMNASRRTFLTVVTASSCSLGTLAFAPLPLVADLGLMMAVGVVLAAACALLARVFLGADDVADTAADGVVAPVASPRLRLVAGAVLALLVVGSVGGWIALKNVPLATDVDQFAAGLPALQESRDVETVLGSSGEVSVVVGGSDVLRPESLAWMNEAWDGIVAKYGDKVRPIVSPPTLLSFLGEHPTAEQIDAAYRLLPLYLTRSVVSPDRSVGAMSFGVTIDDLGGLAEVMKGVKRNLPAAAPGDETRISGLPLVLLRAEELVAETRYQANVFGILAAGTVLLTGLRRRGDALRGILAATLATGCGFALVALSGGGLNPISGALGALTAAVGCEFTVMLAEGARGRPLLRRAVVLVAATSSAGYLVLLASGLDAVRSFGLFLAEGVGLALIASWAVVAVTVRAPSPQPGPALTLVPDRQGVLA